MGHGLYVLNAEGVPVKEHDLHKWGAWFESASNRVVAQTDLPGDVSVSTVFLGLDHNHGAGPSILWETMIFGGQHNGWQDRYTSKAAAILGHEHAVAIARGDAA